jgi:DnaJ-class molecular chaperone
MGFNAGRRSGTAKQDGDSPFGWDDTFQLFGGQAGASAHAGQGPEGRPVRNAERKALHTLGLEGCPSSAEIKKRFKQLVKRHHPDANGGDRSTEERLKDVIQAYNYLKAAGFC